MDPRGDGFERQMTWLMTWLNRPWKIVLTFDLFSLIAAVLVMRALGGLNFPALLIVLLFSTGFSYFIGRGLIDYHSLHQQQHTDLQRVNEELELRNEELRAFSYTVAHDLKTPLMNIKGYTHLLQRAENHPEINKADILGHIDQSANKMAEIIDELLLLANIGSSQVTWVRLSMEEIVANACTRLEPTVQATGAKINIPDSWPVAYGYKPWIEEIWVNYISNAIKYGGSPPVISLGADADNGKVRFWVRDNGSGIPEDAQKFLFQEFSRLGGSQAEGYGLGLAIVRRILEKLGGDFGVISSPGKGACFYFTLPANT